MKFQGENCTLSFSLHFTSGQIMLSGSIWQGKPGQERPGQEGSGQERSEQERSGHPPVDPIRFSAYLTESDLIRIQHWLTDTTAEPLPMPEPIRQMRRMAIIDDDCVHLELEYHRPVPPWWDWAVTEPLLIRLRIGPSEFAYLTNSLRRDHWMTNLNW